MIPKKDHGKVIPAAKPISMVHHNGHVKAKAAISALLKHRRAEGYASYLPARAAASSRSTSVEGGGAPWTPAEGEVGIRVRMYRVGFGDFFLISCLNDEKKPLHIIVDCGVFRGTKQSGDIHSIEAAVDDMVHTTGGRISLVIMTHRHADHIAGFARCADTFKKLTVGSVWMPIWECEYEPIAVKYQAELTRIALGLRQHFAALGDQTTAAENTARNYMENATGEALPHGVAMLGAGAVGANSVALDLLKHGFAGVTPEYYKAGDKAKLPQSLIDAGMTCQILGPPPIDDLDLMKLMDLQKNIGQYLTDSDMGESGFFSPFESEWEIDPASAAKEDHNAFYASESFREWMECVPRRFGVPITDEQAAQARTKMEKTLQQLQPVATLTAAKQLNAFLNNQSLVVLFTYKGKKLLFVGDAQAGNWEHWLFETDVPDKTASSNIATAAREILSSINLYKVGHHGSGNATPKAAVDAMGRHGHNFVSLCSTQADVYGTEDPDDMTKGTEVPRIPLLEKLASESALVRSDQIPITVDGEKIEAKVNASLPVPAAGARIKKGTVWVDCYL